MSRSNFAAALLSLALLALCLLVSLLGDQYQRALTTPIVALSALFALAWCIPLARDRERGETDWFHPSVLLTGFYLVYFLFSGIWLWAYHDYDSEFVDLGSHASLIVNQAFSMGFLSMAGYGLGARVFRLQISLAHVRQPLMPVVKPARSSRAIKSKEIIPVALLLFVFGLAFKIYHLAQFGSLSGDLLLYLSPTAALDLGLNISQFVVMMESMLDWAVLLAILYLIVRYTETGKVRGIIWVCVAVVVVAMLDYIISGKRSAVIFFIVLPVIWYHYLVRRLTSRSALVLLVSLIVAIVTLLLGRVVLPLLMQGLVPTDYVGVSPIDVLAFYLDSGEISTFDMVAATIARKDELLLQAGGSIAGFLKFTFSSLVVFVPRLFWTDKPDYLDLSHVYRRVLVGPEEGMGIASSGRLP